MAKSIILVIFLCSCSTRFSPLVLDIVEDITDDVVEDVIEKYSGVDIDLNGNGI